MEEICKRPGCSGKIVDGICEDCGRPPQGTSLLSNEAGTSKPVSTGSVSLASGTTSASSSLSGRSSASGRSGRSSSRLGSASTRSSLGAGFISLPPLPSMDPLKSLMAEAVVPERKRSCGSCGEMLHHEKGFCPMCGTEYSFVPTLKAGDVIGGQYEVRGAMAFGGLGWIYLGWDKTLQRWVVLKGLLNSKDEASAAAALAERQFLAAVKHPKIVGIYNFITEGSEGYIVMEYVGGKTLKELRQERGPLPVAEAIAYMHAILPAFGYLQHQGLVYCDFKPDNVMLEEGDVKLIDMGGVRRVDDVDGDIYGTKGYSAPEAGSSPSYSSDLYTVARTLAILIMDFKFQGAFEFTLPTPQEQPLFEKYDSLYRFLLRATHKDPDVRFQTADEMAGQLLGVLREVVAESGPPRPLESALFTGDVPVEPDEAQVEDETGPGDVTFSVPGVKPDALDSAANLLVAAAALAPNMRKATIEGVIRQHPESSEAKLRLAETYIADKSYADADRLLAQAASLDAFDWRVPWYQGISLASQAHWRDAASRFNAICSELPGELAPKLALALCAERAGDIDGASYLYDLISRTDPDYVSASLGLARCRKKSKNRAGIADALGRVSSKSSLYVHAQLTLARALLQPLPDPPGRDELARASEVIKALNIEGMARHRLAADLLISAVDRLTAKAIQPDASTRILDLPLEIKELRAGAEAQLRICARIARSADERLALVDEANRVRPRTLF